MPLAKLFEQILSINLEQSTPESLRENLSQSLSDAGILHDFKPLDTADDSATDNLVIILDDSNHLILKDHGLTQSEQRQLNNLIQMAYQYVVNRVSNLIGADDLSQKSLDADKSINPYTLELMGEKAKIGTWTLDMSSQQPYWSKAVREIHSVDEDYVPSISTAINFYKEGWSRDLITERVNHSIETGEPWDEELIIVDANGDEKWVRALGRVFTVGDEKVLSGIFQDITEQRELIDNLRVSRQLEEDKSRRLQLAVESARIGFWDMNMNTNTLEWDEGMFDMYGAKRDEFNGTFEDWSKHVHVDDLPGAIEAFERALASAEYFDTEFRIIDATTGEEKIIKGTAQVVYDADDKPERMVGVNYDITEQTLYVRKQEEIAKLAHEASKAKSQFLASMSHEIRTPLNGVIGMLGLLRKEDLPEHVSTKVKVADRSAHTLMVLINDILDLSKIEDGKMTLEAVDFSLDHGTDMIADVFKYQVADKGLELNVIRDFPKEVIINSDPTRIRQVVFNLMSNAVKFTEQGKIDVRVRLTGEGDTAQLKIVISDTGIGIPEELHGKLFERFTQADSSTTRKFGGTGLGLAITSNLVELLGGKIRLQSEVGSGTRFTVIIPVSINPDAKYDKVTDSNLSQSNQTTELETPELGHILIAEDNKVNQMVITAQLKSHCKSLTVVENGQLALDALNDNSSPFDMILMDCEMPVMDGYEATQAIRNGAAGDSNHAIPIVALTAKAFQEDRDRCFAVGMNGFIAKPIKVDHLLEEMYRLL